MAVAALLVPLFWWLGTCPTSRVRFAAALVGDGDRRRKLLAGRDASCRTKVARLAIRHRAIVETNAADERPVSRIRADRIEPRMHAEQDQARRMLLLRELEPAVGLVHVTEARVQRRNPPCRDDALLARAAVSSSSMRRASAMLPAAASRCASPNDGPAMPPASRRPALVCRARLVESPKRFERAREIGMRAGETRVELDRHAKGHHRLLVLAREIVHVAEDGMQHDRERIEADRLSARRRAPRRAARTNTVRAPTRCTRWPSAGFSSIARRSEGMPPRRSPVCVWTMPMRDVRIGEGGIELERAPRGVHGGRCGLGRWRHPARRAKDVAIRER